MTITVHADEPFTASITVQGETVRFFEGTAQLNPDSPALAWLRERPHMTVVEG